MLIHLRILVLVQVISTSSLCAQDAPEEVAGLLTRLLTLSATLHQNDYTIVHIEVDKLKERQSYKINRKLFSSNVYKIVGVGGVGIKDLDIYVHDENNNLIVEDTTPDNIPEVNVAPKWSGDYRITTKLYDLEDIYSPRYEYFFCFIIAYKR